MGRQEFKNRRDFMFTASTDIRKILDIASSTDQGGYSVRERFA